jgi:hypothetical protein
VTTPPSPALLRAARETVNSAAQDGLLDLATFGARLAITYTTRTLPGPPGPAVLLAPTGREIALSPTTTVPTRERYALNRHLARYLRLLGEEHWRLGVEIGPPEVLERDGEIWHIEGKHRLICARLLQLPAHARTLHYYPPTRPNRRSSR